MHSYFAPGVDAWSHDGISWSAPFWPAFGTITHVRTAQPQQALLLFGCLARARALSLSQSQRPTEHALT
eukprot:COSAG05_NODE_16959_length_335_cov_0.627119_1_plen_68_part_10